MLEHLVVQKIVGKPSTLLPKKSEQKSRSNVHGEAVRVVHHSYRSKPHAHVEGAFVGVITLGTLEHSHHNQLRPQITVSFLKFQLTLILVLHALRDEVTDIEFLHHGLRALGVECCEDVCHVISSVGEDDSTSGMVVPVRDIVDLVSMNDPGVIGGNLSDSARQFHVFNRKEENDEVQYFIT